MKCKIKTFALTVWITILFMACGDPKMPQLATEQRWNLETLKNRAVENLNSDNWNITLFKQDVENYNKFAEIFIKYPLNNHPFPVADYDYAVYSNPFTMKMDSIIFKGIQIGEYEDPNSDRVSTKLTLIVLTNNDKIEPESFVDSRNYPYLTAEGSFNLPQNEFKWIFSSSPDGYSNLFFSMKLFDLRFGETIIIYPQNDNSFLYTQIEASPNDYSEFNDYVKMIKENERNLNRLKQISEK